MSGRNMGPIGQHCYSCKFLMSHTGNDAKNGVLPTRYCNKHSFTIPTFADGPVCSDYVLSKEDNVKRYAPSKQLFPGYLYVHDEYRIQEQIGTFKQVDNIILGNRFIKWFAHHRLTLSGLVARGDKFVELDYGGAREKFRVRQDPLDFVTDDPYVMSSRLRKWLVSQYQKCDFVFKPALSGGFGQKALLEIWFKRTDEPILFEVIVDPRHFENQSPGFEPRKICINRGDPATISGPDSAGKG